MPIDRGVVQPLSGETVDLIADPAAIVRVGPARFTFLTDALVRMEWCADETFEDRASLAIINRRHPALRASTNPGATA